MERIIITSDLFRPLITNGQIGPFHTKRINKYYYFLELQLRLATGLPIERLNAPFTTFDPVQFYKLCGLTCMSEENWFKLYDIKEVPQEAILYYGKFIHKSLVIYHEAPNFITKIHEQLSIPFIDMLVHPVRFMDDHLWAMASNVQLISNNIRRYSVDTNLFYFGANCIKAICAQDPLPIDINSALLVGQTLVDISVFDKTKNLTIFDFEQEITELGDTYEKVYFRPHPYQQGDKKVKNFISSFRNIEFTTNNTYRFLGHDNIEEVVAISSSVLQEAMFFGKKIRYLHKNPKKYEYSRDLSDGSYKYSAITSDVFMTPHFWHDILTGIIPTVTHCPPFQINSIPNRVRSTFNDYWAFTELDPIVRTVRKELGPQNAYIRKQIDLLKTDIAQKKHNFVYINKITNSLANSVGKKIHSLYSKIKRRRLNKACFKHYLTLTSRTSAVPSKQDIKLIHCLTYRPSYEEGSRGGAGAVLSLVRDALKTEIDNIPIKYSSSGKGPKWHTNENKYFNTRRFPSLCSEKSNMLFVWASIQFVIDETQLDPQETLYICHDFATAFGLSLLKKKYIFVMHSQGPRVEEIITRSEKISFFEKEDFYIKKMEAAAIKNAIFLCCPSEGAVTAYFSSKYAGISKKYARLGPPLYNTNSSAEKSVGVQNIFTDESSLKFLSVGTISEAKGQDRIIPFLENLLDVSNKKIEWCVVGRGPLQEKVIAQAKQLASQNNRFVFNSITKCSHEEVIFLNERADIYIMLHRLSIFDIATLEAMSSNSAVILSKTGGNLEYNKSDNIIFYDGSAEKLVREFIQIDIEQIKRLNLTAYQQYFSLEAFRNRYASLIRAAISELKIQTTK